MKHQKSNFYLLTILFILLFYNFNSNTKTVKEVKSPKTEAELIWNISGMFKPGDSFYGKNISLLNNHECQDRIFYARHTLDFNLDVQYGKIDPIAAMKFTIRNRAHWGNPEIAPTTIDTTKFLESVGQPHSHYLPRHIFWMREAWLELSLNKISNMDFRGKKQTFKLGAFPFQLGRGIALGDAYAVGPDYIGFYSDTTVDQFAFGFKLGGEISNDKLTYDLYGAILNNLSNNLRNTGAKILGQEYGKLNCPARGFGKVAIVIAGRLDWIAFNNKNGKFSLEPYCLVYSDPEQTVEFVGDATSKLGTIGLAGEYEQKRFEFGFDCAINLGAQNVKGWDRNTIQTQNRNGQTYLINSDVLLGIDPKSKAAQNIDLSNYYAPYTSTTIQKQNDTNAGPTPDKSGSIAQGLINKAPQAEAQNGKSIGIAKGFSTATNAPVVLAEDTTQTLFNRDELFNASERFRDPFRIKYKGFMFVSDFAFFCYDRDLRIAGTVGYASGDADPTFEEQDGVYEGFIGLQELYNGIRVKSSFFLGGTSKVKIPLDLPTPTQNPSDFADSISGLSNLAFLGAGIKWQPHHWKKRFFINPNIFAYWLPHPDKKFDLETKSTLPCPSRSFLGVELNVFLEKDIISDLKLFLITSVFLPGSHFKDVKGKPLNPAQFKMLDQLDQTGFEEDIIPNIGDDPAFAFNIGFEYKF